MTNSLLKTLLVALIALSANGTWATPDRPLPEKAALQTFMRTGPIEVKGVDSYMGVEIHQGSNGTFAVHQLDFCEAEEYSQPGGCQTADKKIRYYFPELVEDRRGTDGCLVVNLLPIDRMAAPHVLTIEHCNGFSIMGPADNDYKLIWNFRDGSQDEQVFKLQIISGIWAAE